MSFARVYYGGAHGVVIMYDITNRSSFDNVERFLEEKRRSSKEQCAVLLLGCKSDLNDQRVVSEAEGRCGVCTR
jgi:GTPase SAR1 family protein